MAWFGANGDLVLRFNPKDLDNDDARADDKKTRQDNVTEKDRVWGGLLASFVTNVSVVGLKYAVDAQAYLLRRLLWVSLVLFGFGVFLYQVTDRLQYYLAYPSSAKTSLRYVPSLPIPTMTICNENMFSKYRAAYLGLAEELGQIYLEDASPTARVPEGLEEQGVSSPFGNIQLNPNLTLSNWTYIISELGAKKTEFFTSCQFSGEPCHEDMFIRRLTDLNYCFSTNVGEQNYTLASEGIRSGLVMILNANQWDYLGISSPSVGFRMLFHERDELPMMFDKARKIPVDRMVILSVTMRKVRDLGPPYGSCVDIPGYRESMCRLQCYKRYLVDACGCREAYMEGDEAVCDMYEYHLCVKDARQRFIQKKTNTSLMCDCPPECCYTKYQAQMSMSGISDYFTTALSSMMGVPKEWMIGNFSVVYVYYEDMLYEDVQIVPSYPLFALLSDVGGAFGLILGSTVLTVVEFLDFFSRAIVVLCAQKRQQKNQLPQVTQVRPASVAPR